MALDNLHLLKLFLEGGWYNIRTHAVKLETPITCRVFPEFNHLKF